MPDSTLSVSTVGEPIHFTFLYRGVFFTARLTGPPGAPVLTLAGALATLPYTAQSAELRRLLLALIAAPKKAGRTRLGPSQVVLVEEEIPITAPPTPRSLIAAAAGALLRLRPIIALAGELAFPPGAPGAG